MSAARLKTPAGGATDGIVSALSAKGRSLSAVAADGGMLASAEVKALLRETGFGSAAKKAVYVVGNPVPGDSAARLARRRVCVKGKLLSHAMVGGGVVGQHSAGQRVRQVAGFLPETEQGMARALQDQRSHNLQCRALGGYWAFL